MYRALLQKPEFDGFDLNTGSASPENKQVFVRVMEAIYHDYGGVNKCPWTKEQMRGASTTYLKSLIDAKVRQQRNGSDSHRETCRRQGRLREKVERRLIALNRIEWSDETKAEVRAVLVPEYTSSDESEYSEDEDGSSGLLEYRVKHLPWERSRLTSAKSKLDTVYERSLSRRFRNARVPRVAHQTNSCRSIPEDAVEWAVRISAQPLMSQRCDINSSLEQSDVVPSTPSSSNSNLTSTPISVPCPVPRPRSRVSIQLSPNY